MSHHTDIFVQAPSEVSLDDFVQNSYASLNIPAYEQRESSHYIESRYFRSIGHSLDVKACLLDEPDFSEYRFWVRVSSDSDSTNSAAVFASALAKIWPSCFVPSTGWGRKDWDGSGTSYSA